ncbi:uncharacterized protein LOC111714724 isoform X2 [Eurytemora carolleeae]|uniref:uncharacterized protein LOC111714724 isoform X2 n=1 Tax=Eurytemora carolleeae TaxID=1294199 RepID=UPI000C78B622|nr:uncharacterized protein LOC111714724 isoform X2 [Eurytemora carolleeae]|eukprot:XP_023345655.1 uncharacterized protein LOC111714724 isoform X2 [Eurytemora affinis]
MLLTMLQIKLYKTFGNHGRAKNTELPKKWIYGVPWLNPVHLISVRSVSSQQALDLDFSDHQKVFRFKSTGDLLRSLAILKICSINSFVENALPVMRKCEQLFGERMFAMVARPTFYRQFVGGETEEELRHSEQTFSLQYLKHSDREYSIKRRPSFTICVSFYYA